ncbi:MAG: PD40 domain-containing protein [Deltaproteobacteria bacterium]|nr:PD40 domain-containing protein [Deltaproteobacteria bacterium]
MMRARILGFLCALAACASHHGSTKNDADATLTIGPPTSELLILNGAPATEDFTATLTYPDGSTKDVTGQVTFSIDSGFGSFTAQTLAMTTAGKATVLGAWSDKSATAQVIARVKDIRVDPSLPANTPDLFANGTEDPATAPSVVYPPAGVVMPRNLGDFEVHWTDATAHDIYEISLTTEFADVKAYVGGGNGAAAAGPNPGWMSFLAAEWLAAVGYEPTVQYRVRALLSSNPGTIGAGAPRMVQLTNEDMLGGMYYWAATSSTGGAYGIFRHDMSEPGVPAEQYMTTVQAGRCVACHVLSRDGKEMAITYDGGNWSNNTNTAAMVDVASSARQDLSNKWNFGTFTPDGAKFLSAYLGTITVRRYADQSAIVAMPSAGPATHPDLSPDGTKLVYVRPTGFGTDWSFTQGGIYWRTYDANTDTFGPETPLVVDSSNNYYPSWSPDGNWVLFNRAPSGDAYNNANASLYVIKATGGPAMELTAADQAPAGLTNSWGRWAPFQQTLGANAEPMFWVTVSSKRDFGVRLVGQARPQIWMTPFFPNQASSSVDPSNAPFRLPFQDITSDNHIAQWTQKVVTTQ